MAERGEGGDASGTMDPERPGERGSLDLFSTEAEASFDHVTRQAVRLLDVPVAYVALLDAENQYVKSCIGLPDPLAGRRTSPRDQSFCQFPARRRETAALEDFADSVAAEIDLRLEIERRREAESALAAREAEFRTLVEQATDVVTVLGPDGTVRYESPSLERVLGWRPSTGTIRPESTPAGSGCWRPGWPTSWASHDSR